MDEGKEITGQLMELGEEARCGGPHSCRGSLVTVRGNI